MKSIQIFPALFCAALLLNACKSGDDKSITAPKVEDVSLGAPKHLTTDPVCKMELETLGKDSTIYEGKTYHFCSATCKGDFDANPKSYATK